MVEDKYRSGLVESAAVALYDHWLRDTAPELRTPWDEASSQLTSLFRDKAEVVIEALTT